MRFRRVCLTGSALALAACGPRPPAVAPPAGVPVPAPPVRQPTGPGIRFVPTTQRYVIHARRRVEQEGASQPTEMAYRVFLSARVAGPADTAGYAVTHTVDSIVPDSAAFVPPNVNFAAARGLRFSGRLTPWGEVRGVTASDSLQAANLGQLLGSLCDFYPRLPRGGLQPGATWTDTVTSAGCGPASEVVSHAVLQSTAAAWEPCHGARCVRVEVQGPYTLLGTGERGGQPFELVGSGTHWALEFVSADGRYLGGELRDSASLSVNLPAQGMTIPIRQILHSTVTVLP